MRHENRKPKRKEQKLKKEEKSKPKEKQRIHFRPEIFVSFM